MIFWYKDLYMDEKVRKQEKKCKKIIEERSIFQKLPWKKSFYIITLAENEKNLFDLVCCSYDGGYVCRRSSCDNGRNRSRGRRE